MAWVHFWKVLSHKDAMPNSDEHTKSIVQMFLSERQYCVLSTVNDEYQPESALLQYLTKDLDLIMNTFHFSRKMNNISSHTSVSIVVGFGNEKKTLQYEWTVEVLTWEARVKAADEYNALYPKWWSSELDNLVDWLYVRPRWVRFVDLSGDELEECIIEF